MAHPFLPVPQEPSTQGHGARSCEGIQSLQLLVAPDGQLSADGQLRELMLERRRKVPPGAAPHDSSGGLWFLPEPLCHQLLGRAGVEALVLQASSTAIWLQLRFGGQLRAIQLPADWLLEQAMRLPPAGLATAVEPMG